jgi:hypothetical protein
LGTPIGQLLGFTKPDRAFILPGLRSEDRLQFTSVLVGFIAPPVASFTPSRLLERFLPRLFPTDISPKPSLEEVLTPQNRVNKKAKIITTNDYFCRSGVLTAC